MKIDTRYSVAVIVLALLGAGCADEPRQTGQATVQSTKVAAITPAAPAAANDDHPVGCVYGVVTGTMIHKWICPITSQNGCTAQCKLVNVFAGLP